MILITNSGKKQEWLLKLSGYGWDEDWQNHIVAKHLPTKHLLISGEEANFIVKKFCRPHLNEVIKVNTTNKETNQQDV